MDLQWPMRVVSSGVDNYVLTVMALTSDATFTTGQLARLVPASEEGVRKVLSRLSVQGIVTAERVGPAVAYRFNDQHLAAAPIRALAHLRADLLRRITEAMGGWKHEPRYAAVFGSVGRGDSESSSDIDLFIVRPELALSEEDAWSGQLDQLAQQVYSWTGNQLEIVEYDEDSLATDEPLVHDVRNQGLTVFGEPTWFRRAVREAPVR